MQQTKMMKLKHPFSMLVAGPTSSGKTVFVRSLLRDHKQTTTVDCHSLSVLWIHGQEQELHSVSIQGVDIKYVYGFPDTIEDNETKPHVIVCDDMMAELGSDKRLTALFTKTSHHMKISVIFIVQNLFFHGKEIRTISLNCQYIVLLKSVRDKQQVLALGRQIFPHNQSFFKASLEAAHADPYAHLLIDLTSSCDEGARLRQRVVNGWTVYQKR